MNSGYDKKFSLDEMTEMNMPKMTLDEEIPMVQITEEDWVAMAQTIAEIKAATTALTNATKELTAATKEQRKAMRELGDQTKKSVSQIENTATSMLGKLNENATSRAKRRAELEDSLWWLRLLLTALPTVLVLLLAVYLGWLRL